MVSGLQCTFGRRIVAVHSALRTVAHTATPKRTAHTALLPLEIVGQFEVRFTVEQFEVTVEQFVEIEQFEMSVQQFERAEQIEMAKQSVVRAATRAAAEIFSCAFGGTSVKSRSCAFGGGISFPPDGCMRAHRAEAQ